MYPPEPIEADEGTLRGAFLLCRLGPKVIEIYTECFLRRVSGRRDLPNHLSLKHQSLKLAVTKMTFAKTL